MKSIYNAYIFVSKFNDLITYTRLSKILNYVYFCKLIFICIACNC